MCALLPALYFPAWEIQRHLVRALPLSAPQKADARTNLLLLGAGKKFRDESAPAAVDRCGAPYLIRSGLQFLR